MLTIILILGLIAAAIYTAYNYFMMIMIDRNRHSEEIFLLYKREISNIKETLNTYKQDIQNLKTKKTRRPRRTVTNGHAVTNGHDKKKEEK